MGSQVNALFFIFFVLTQVFGSNNNDCGQIASNDSVGFPWNVGIYLENQNQVELICLGSIIHSKAVLTDAHCFGDNLGNSLRNESFYIATGVLKKKVNSKSIPSNFQKIPKTNIIIHKYYKGLINFFSNDLAIAKGKFQFSDKIKPVCVDWAGDIKTSKSAGKQSIWYKDKLINIEQTYLDEFCADEAPEEFIPFITNDKSCAKIKGSGIVSNHESEGSGIVFLNSENNRWYLKGVTSLFETSQGKLSTYSLVNQYLNWLSNIYASL